MKTLTRLLAALLTALLIVAAAPAAAQDEPVRDPMADLVLSADELTADAQKGTTLDENSLLPANPDDGLRATFTTQIIEAPIPFNAVVPHWTGDAAAQIEDVYKRQPCAWASGSGRATRPPATASSSTPSPSRRAVGWSCLLYTSRCV